MAEKAEIVENEFGVDVAVNTIRGRACPICEGKIIPSNRAVYQSTGNPSEVFPLWECERCGFSETYAPPDDPKKITSPAPKAIAGKATGDQLRFEAFTSSLGIGGCTRHKSKLAGLRPNELVPADVEKMLEVMNRKQPETKP